MLPSTPKSRDKRSKARETKARRKSSMVKMEEDTDYSDTQSSTPPSPQEDMQENTVDSTVQIDQQDLSIVSPCEVPDWSSSVEIGPDSFSHRFEVSPEHDCGDYDEIIQICQQLESETQWMPNSSDCKGFLSNDACTSPESLWSDSSSVDELDSTPQYTTLGSDFTNTTDDFWSLYQQLSLGQ